MKRRGFTIVELLMVITVISVLITITTSAVFGSMKKARVQKAEALCQLVEQGLNTYNAQMGKWPFKDDKELEDDEDYCTLTDSETKEAIFELVKEAKKHNPMMDISGLHVSTRSGTSGSKHFGMDFMRAVLGSAKNPERVPASTLYYGYPEANRGYFRNFKIKYYPVTDKVKVEQ